MGLDASVMCTCYAEGKIKTPPNADRVHVDEEGFLSLDLPWEGHTAEHIAFMDWTMIACAHPRMEAAHEHIGNWATYRLFQEALGDAGWDHFPTLRRTLPNNNDGLASTAQATSCLDELAVFERLYRAEVSALFDSDTGDVLHEHVRSYEGVFLLGGTGFDVGVDDAGLFVRERAAPRRECFRAMRIEQRPLELEGGVDGAELVDLDGTARRIVRMRIHGHAIPWPDGRMQNDEHRFRFSCPTRLHVARTSRTAGAFRDVLRALSNVFRASVSTGNPVRWL